MENDILQVANEMQINIQAEGDAIEKYGIALRVVNDSNLDQNSKDEIYEEIIEIIGDEMNHIDKLKKLYTLLTGIEPNKD